MTLFSGPSKAALNSFSEGCSVFHELFNALWHTSIRLFKDEFFLGEMDRLASVCHMVYFIFPTSFGMSYGYINFSEKFRNVIWSNYFFPTNVGMSYGLINFSNKRWNVIWSSYFFQLYIGSKLCIDFLYHLIAITHFINIIYHGSGGTEAPPLGAGIELPSNCNFLTSWCGPWD